MIAKYNIQFSVLMSVYYKEKEKNLEQALVSLLTQTVMPNEIVVVKDGPLTEELNTCLNNYSEQYDFIKIVELAKNVGLGNALNEGLKYCSYEYVARMDSDDICIKDRFEKQISFLLEHPDVDALGGYIMEFDDETGNDLSMRKVPLSKDDILKFVKKRNPMNHMTVIFKKQSVLNVGNYIDCKYFEDYYLWARMLSQNMLLLNIDEVLVKARAGKKLSLRRGSKNYIKCIKNFEKKMLNLKLINNIEYVYLVGIKSIIAILPNNIRYNIYQKKLRN